MTVSSEDYDNMKKQNLKLKLKFELMYFALYGTMACYFPFLALYFESRNLSYTQIGIAFAINSLVGIVAQPVWGYVTDKYLNKKKTLLIASIFCSVLIYGFIFAHSFQYIIISIILLLTFQSVTSPISDAYCYDVIEQTDAFHFGEIRLAGSFGFALVSVVLGNLIEYAGLNSSFVLYSILFIINAYLLYGLSFEDRSTIKRPKFRNLLNLIKQFKFMVFVFSVMIMNIALGANSSYIVVLIKETGGNTSIIGFVWFVIAISELPAFFFGSRIIKKYGELNIFLISVALYAIRFLMCSFEQSYTTIIAIQLMQGVTFPLYLIGVMQHLSKIVPEDIRASGITILSSLGFGLGNFIGNLSGGILLENQDIFFLYRLLAVICIISLLAGIFLKSKVSK